MMRRAGMILPLALVLAGCLAQRETGEVRGGFAVGNEDRVVIYGDSITAAFWLQTYPRYIETYIRARYPDWKGELWNRGKGGDHAGNLRRYRAECLALDPTVITFNMGMNGISTEADYAKTMKRYVGNLEAVVAETRTNCPNARLFLCSAIPYEARMSYGKTRATVGLWTAAHEERRLAERLGVPFVDVNRAMYETYGVMEAFAPGRAVISNDGVHPGCQGGHFLMAVAFLEGLGAEPHLAFAEIDAAKGEVVAARDVAVRNVTEKDGRLAFERTLSHLPFPAVNWLADAQQAYADREMYGRFRIADRLNRDILRVTGLPAAAYTLVIDGRAYETYASEELAEGVNLGECCVTPDFDQACRLSDAIGAKHIAQDALRRAQQEKKPDTGKVEEARRAVESRLAEVVRVAHAETHRFELVPFAGAFDCWNRHQETVLVRFCDRRAEGAFALTAGADGRFRGSAPFELENLSDRPRRVEAIFPAGFSPAAVVRTLAAREKCVETVSYDLEPEAPAASIVVKHVRADHLLTPVVQQVNLHLARRRAFGKGVDGSYESTFELRPETGGDRVRWLGPADCSGTVRLAWKDGLVTIEGEALDQDHFNGYTDERIGWDDSLCVVYGKKSVNLALTKEGVKVISREDGVKGSVTRDGFRTLYRLTFPAEEPKGEMPLSLTLCDRDSDQQSKSSTWHGTLDVR